jgi:outer membrane protein OmpA-like peptidoglycan-associated protein
MRMEEGREPSSLPRRRPFAPYGLAPLAGLIALMMVALAPFAFGEIQAAADAATRRALSEMGADWARAEISGQWVTLEGKPPSREGADQAIAAVKAAKSQTLFGEASPVTLVLDHFTWTEDALLPGSGNRPLIGVTSNDRAAPAPPPSEEQLASCENRMNALLKSATIEFSSASTKVSAASEGLLDSIAEAVTACPGVLRIEGHTDNVGRGGFNLVLSRKRAEAVRAALVTRGVPGARLLAEGLGSRQPIASNANGQGRARNRRIEIHAVRSSPT